VDGGVLVHFSLEKGAFFHSFRACKRDCHDFLRKKAVFLFMLIRIEFHAYSFPDDAVHAS
jgi:hypothetical protein